MEKRWSFWERELFLGACDILVVGSGIVGLTTAITLKSRCPNKRVLVLEKGALPSGASTKNAGFACIGSPSEIISDIERDGLDSVLRTIEKRWRGLLNLRALLGDDGINYLENGSYELFRPQDERFYQESCEHLNDLNKYLKEITQIENNFALDSSIIAQSEFEGFTYAISNCAEGQINPGKMMKALFNKARSTGVEILMGCEVLSVDAHQVSTNLGNIKFKQLAFCTNGFSQKFFPSLDVLPARAQVLITQPLVGLKWKGIFHFERGYYYFRNVGNRILFGGGRNLDIQGETTESLETTEQIISHLINILETQIYPKQKIELDISWAGIMGVGESKSPIVKEVDENIYCAARLGGMGIAIGSLIGQELAEIILA